MLNITLKVQDSLMIFISP